MRSEITLLFSLFLSLIPIVSFAAPNSLSATGTVSTGATVTITGADFGTGPNLSNIMRPTTIDATTVGQTPANGSGWIFDQPAGTAAVASSTQSHSGGKSLLHVPNPNSVLRFDYGASIGTNQTIFVTWWTRRNSTSAGQWKMFRVHPTNDIEDSYVPEFHMFNWYNMGSDNFGVRPGPATNSLGTDSYMSSVMTDAVDTWYRMELLVSTASSVGASDGVFEMRRYIPGSTFASSVETGKMNFNATNNFYRWFQWQNYQGNGMSGLNVYTDDHIVQVGSQARVELCDSPSWASRTSCDMQIPTSWASGEIAVTVNTGAFAAEAPAYLYVIDSTGAVNSLGYEVEIGASGGVEDTTPPVLSLLAPSGTLAAGTTSTTISHITDEAATCRYSATPGTAYEDMTLSFDSSYAMSHSATVSGLTNGGSYNRYARCIDGVGNANTTDAVFSFSVASSAGTAGTLSWQYSTYSAERADVRIPINIIRTGGSTGSVTAQWSSNGQTATHDVDYYGNDNVTVTFADGVTSIPINTYGSGDNGILMIANGADDDRYFQMILTNPTGGATLGTTLATVTIEGDYVAPVPGMRVGVGRTPISVGQTPITPMQ